MFADYTVPKLNTTLVLEVVNGNGIGNGGEELLFDRDSYKNVLGWITQPVGKFMSIGAMAYAGKERLASPGIYYNSVRMIGPSVTFDFDQKLLLKMQYIRRSDSQVFDETSSLFLQDVITQGGYLEATLAPKGDNSKFYYTALLNYVDSDFSHINYKSATMNISYVLRRNFRLVSEYTWLSGEEEYGKLSLGFVSAF